MPLLPETIARCNHCNREVHFLRWHLATSSIVKNVFLLLVLPTAVWGGCAESVGPAEDPPTLLTVACSVLILGFFGWLLWATPPDGARGLVCSSCGLQRGSPAQPATKPS